MIETRPPASLSATLLARKGAARPAMRPQRYDMLEAEDDLGWNDMGWGEEEVRKPAPRPALTPMPQIGELAERISAWTGKARPAPVAPPPPLQEPSELAQKVAELARRLQVPQPGQTCPLTIRITAEQHRRLSRAAQAVGRTPQDIMADALDIFLSTLPQGDDEAVETGEPIWNGTNQ